MDEGSVHACVAPTAGSDHFLLHDLLHAHRGFLYLVVIGRHPVAARVAHDRVGRNHRAAGGTGDLRFAASSGLGLDRDLRDRLRHLHNRDRHLRDRLRRDGSRVGRHGLRPNSRLGCGRRRDGSRGDGGHRDGSGRHGFDRLLLGDQRLLAIEETLPLFRDFRAGCREVLFLGRELPLALHEFPVPTDLRLERRLLVFEELDDLLLPRGDLGLARRDVFRVRDRLRVAPRDLLFPSHERRESLREFLLASDERVLFGEHLLSRGAEFLFPVGDGPFTLLEFLLAGAHPFLAADERIPLIREGRSLLIEDPPVFLDLGPLFLERGLALSELRVPGLQVFFELFQCVQRVQDRSFGHLQCAPMWVRGAEPPRRRRASVSHEFPPVSKIGPRTVSPPFRTSIACFSIEWSTDRIFSTWRYRTSFPRDRSRPSITMPSTRNPSFPRSWLSPFDARSMTTREVSSLSRSILKK